ncbi:MAG: glycine betaine ABC transporter substrate-binding protein [Actinomycetaceae bacterium]
MRKEKNVRSRKSMLSAGATVTALALTLAACGGSGDDAGGTEASGGAEGTEPIVIGIPAGWEEAVAASYLWKHILEEEGYEVETETAELALVYTAHAEGQYDLSFEVWLPDAHAPYMEDYGDDLEELGMWFEEAPLTIAVNEDAPITSLDELAENADQFDNRLIGIEGGAVLTRVTEEELIPTYGLEDMEFVISSTTAMLSELSGAIEAGENVAVTLWRPHWAYDAFPIRDLEDPENVFGEPDDIYVYGHEGCSEEYPEVAEWLGNFYMTDDQLHSLENIMFNEMDGDDPEGAVDQWLEENPDYVDPMLAGEAAGGGSGSESASGSGSESGSESASQG